MARINAEDCLRQVSDRYKLICIAAQRAREINSGSPITVPQNNDKYPVIALREIAKGNLNIPALENQFIESLRSNTKLDFVEGENLYAEVVEEINDPEYIANSSQISLSEDDSTDFDAEQMYTDDIDEENFKN